MFKHHQTFNKAKLRKSKGSKSMIILMATLFFTLIISSYHLVAFQSSKNTNTNPSIPPENIVNTNNFSISDTLSNGNSKSVKVLLLAGQSNASGASYVSYLSQKIDSNRYETFNTGHPNILINYFNENGFNSSNGFVQVRIDQGFMPGFFGPELGMAESFALAYPDETIFIIKYAWGGSNLYNQWLSPSSNGNTGDLYTAFVNFVKTSMNYLISKNYDAKIVAMCWMQGESDSDDINCQTYGTHTANLVSDLRADFSSYISSNGMLFIDAAISDSIYWPNYPVINLAKSNYASTSPLNVFIDTIATGLSIASEPDNEPDFAHYDSLSELYLGNLFAEAIISKLGG